MQDVVLANLRSEFTAAISSNQSDVTLDPAIGELRKKISEPDLLEPFSIYSRGQLRKMHGFLNHIDTARLKDDPFQVALAVEAVLELFNRLEITVRESAESDKRIEAARSS